MPVIPLLLTRSLPSRAILRRSTTTRAFAVTRATSPTVPLRANLKPRKRPSLAIASLLGLVAAGATLTTPLLLDAAPAQIIVDPDSGLAVPTEKSLAGSQFHLVGLGVRQVTLLNFNVYVAALYADEALLNAVKKADKWRKEYTPDTLINGSDNAFYMKDLVRRRAELTLLIKTVRATTGTHLRQGFTRFLNARLAKDVKDGIFTDADEENAADAAIRELEAKFPKGAIDKEEEMWFTKTKNGELRVEFQGRELAIVKSQWLSERFFEGYLAHEKPISNKFRKNVAESLQQIVQS
ncbi:chalcone-flavanone isomerase-domain-containing protein [Chytriomyces sp. MP71]|nr:chalcone-flavanone isomerase-domain-containing protein [Chytriomyces sp. MP71]